MRKSYTYFFCLNLILFFFFVGSSSAMLIFSDNFDSGASQDWGNELGEWTTDMGVYDATSIPGYSSVKTFPNLTDFTVQVDINNLDDGGLMLRSSDWNNGVALITGGRGGGNFSGLYWHIKRNGSWGRILNEVYVPGLFGSDITLKVVVKGDTYEAYINGSTTPVTTLKTSIFSSGKVALYDYSGQTFDNFSISIDSAVPEPSTISLLVVAMGLLLGFSKILVHIVR